VLRATAYNSFRDECASMEMTARSLPTLVKQSERGVERDMLLLLLLLLLTMLMIKYIHKIQKLVVYSRLTRLAASRGARASPVCSLGGR
jgi:hypothetical protein